MIQLEHKKVRVEEAWGSFGVGQELLVREQATVPYYDGAFYVLWGGKKAIPVSNVIDA